MTARNIFPKGRRDPVAFCVFVHEASLSWGTLQYTSTYRTLQNIAGLRAEVVLFGYKYRNLFA